MPSRSSLDAPVPSTSAYTARSHLLSLCRLGEAHSVLAFFRLALLAILAVGCGTPRYPVRFGPKQYGLDGQPGRVDMMGRAFLAANTPPAPGFAYYLDVVFLPGASESDRVAAARAFLDEAAAGDLVSYMEGDPSTIAALLMPITARPGEPEPKRAQEVVRRYDVARAEILASRVRQVHTPLPPVSIVAYPEPIEAHTNLKAEQLLVTDACGKYESVQKKIHAIRDQLQRSEVALGASVAERVLAAFRAIGDAIRAGRFETCSA
jgi:hypothetical protein